MKRNNQRTNIDDIKNEKKTQKHEENRILKKAELCPCLWSKVIYDWIKYSQLRCKKNKNKKI